MQAEEGATDTLLNEEDPTSLCQYDRAPSGGHRSKGRSCGKVGNASGVFQAGVACVFSIVRLLERLRELVGRYIVEAAVRPKFLVLLSPVCDF